MDNITKAAKRLDPKVIELLHSWECQFGTEFRDRLYFKNYLFKTEGGGEVTFSDYELGIVEYPVIEWAKNVGPRDLCEHALNEKVVAVLEKALEGAPTQIIINDPCWNDDFWAILSTEVHVETFDGQYVFSLAELSSKFREQYPDFKMGEPPTIYVRVWNGMVANVFINDPALESVAIVIIDEDVANDDTGEDYTVTNYTHDGVVGGLDDVIKIL